MATQVASLFALLELDDRQYRAGLENARRNAGETQNVFGRLGSGVSSFGRQLTMMTAPLTVALTASVVSAVNFEETMANAGSILGKTADEMAGLNQQVLEIGSRSRAGPQQAAEAFYTIVSGVQDASAHMAILQSAIALSEAGAADLTTTTDGLVAAMNAYRLGAEDAAWVSDVYTRATAMGVGTMDEFVSAISPAASLANSVGISFDELAGSTAFLTTQGNSASSSTTQLMGIMSAFLKPNQAMMTALQDMGFESGQAALEQLGLTGAVEALSDTLGGSMDAMAGTLGTQEALRGSVALLSAGAAEFAETFQGGIEGATEAARAIQMESAAAQFDLLKSSIQGVAIQIGLALLPIINDLIKAIQPIIARISEWITANPELMRTILLVAGAAVLAGPALMVLGAAIGFVTGPIGLAITAAGLLAAAYATNFMGTRDAVDKWFAPGIQSAIDILGQLEIIAPLVWGRVSEVTDAGANLVGVIIDKYFEPGIQHGIDILGQLEIIAPLVWDRVTEPTEAGANLVGIIIDKSFAPGIQRAIDILEWLKIIAPQVWDLFGAAVSMVVDWIIIRIADLIKSIGKIDLGVLEDAANIIGESGVLASAASIIGDIGSAGGGGLLRDAAFFGPLGIIKNILGFAEGGEFEAGRPMMVGERGPEMLFPRVGGAVMPNHELGGMGGTRIDTVNVYANSYAEGAAAARGFRDELEEEMTRRG